MRYLLATLLAFTIGCTSQTKPTPDPVPPPVPTPIPDPIPIPDPVPIPVPDPIPTPVPDPKPKPVKSAWNGENSGMAWKTGIANTNRADECNQMVKDQAAFLHRKADIFASFMVHDDLVGATNHLNSKAKNWKCFSDQKVVISQVVPLLMAADVANVAQVINGTLTAQYVAFWKKFAETMRDAGQTAPIVRLGHEMNLNGGYPWAVPSKVSPAQFVALYKMAADTLKSVLPKTILCWNPGKYSSGATADSMWPGDNYVDVVGVDWYDNGGGGVKVFNAEADWTSQYMATGPNGPRGVGAWYAFAKKHGKPIAFPEWAMKNGKGDPNRTVYVQHMHDFFAMAAKEGFMAYETWYNEPGQHQIYPNTQFPMAAPLYQKLFQPGK